MRRTVSLLLMLAALAAWPVSAQEIWPIMLSNWNMPLPMWFPTPTPGSPEAVTYLMLHYHVISAEADTFWFTIRYKVGDKELTQEQRATKPAYSSYATVVFSLASGQETLLPLPTLLSVRVEESQSLKVVTKTFDKE